MLHNQFGSSSIAEKRAQDGFRSLMIGRLLEDVDRLTHSNTSQARRITPLMSDLMSDLGFLHQLQEILSFYRPGPIPPDEAKQPKAYRAMSEAWLAVKRQDTMEQAVFDDSRSSQKPRPIEAAAKIVFPLQTFRKSIYRTEGNQQAVDKLKSVWQHVDRHVKIRLGESFSEKVSSVIGSAWLERIEEVEKPKDQGLIFARGPCLSVCARLTYQPSQR